MSKFFSMATGLFFGLCAMGITSGSAQEQNGCATTQMEDPPRLVYECANGLAIEAETFAELDAMLGFDQTAARSVEASDRAVLVHVQPGSGPFQIRTPHAIASVRGTVFVVDAQALETSVFVIEGVVAVTRDDGSDAVELNAGEGVAVSAGELPVVKRWPEEKVAALLVRFAR